MLSVVRSKHFFSTLTSLVESSYGRCSAEEPRRRVTLCAYPHHFAVLVLVTLDSVGVAVIEGEYREPGRGEESWRARAPCAYSGARMSECLCPAAAQQDVG